MNILPDSNYEKIHTGSAIETQRLKTILEEKNIFGIVHNDTESAKLGGFAMATPDQSRLLVKKEDVIRAKHFVTNALKDFEQNQISNEELGQLAQNSKEEPVIKHTTRQAKEPEKKPEISKGRALFYGLFIVYSVWRLSPLLRGEEVSTLRIIISSGLILFSISMLIRFFKK